MKLTTPQMFAFLAGRCAARRDAAMENARLEQGAGRRSYVRLARTFNRWMIDEMRRAKDWA